VAGYDIMEVCLNGHQITDSAGGNPQRRKPYCPKCGAKTIIACPECHANIQGYFHSEYSISLADTPVPNNCHNCGTAYPWRQAQIAAAIEKLEMALEGQGAVDVPGLVNDIATDSPRAELAALKLKRLLPKIGEAARQVAIEAFSDVASATLKKTLGL